MILVYCDFIYPQICLAAGDPTTFVHVTKSCKKFLVILKLCCSGYCRLRQLIFMTEWKTWTTPPPFMATMLFDPHSSRWHCLLSKLSHHTNTGKWCRRSSPHKIRSYLTLQMQLTPKNKGRGGGWFLPVKWIIKGITDRHSEPSPPLLTSALKYAYSCWQGRGAWMNCTKHST